MLKKIVLSLVIFVFVAVALVGAGAFFVYHKYKDLTVSAAIFDELEPGSSEVEARKRLPADGVMSTKDVYGKSDSWQTGLSPGEKCLHYLARDQRTGGDGVKVYRLCFKDGKLADKKTVISTT